jgi:hypothetical protein
VNVGGVREVAVVYCEVMGVGEDGHSVDAATMASQYEGSREEERELSQLLWKEDTLWES